MKLLFPFISWRKYFLLFIIFSFCICPSSGMTAEFPVYTEPLAPVHFEEGGNIKGIATEIVNEIFKEAGLLPKFEIYPWKRAYQKALATDESFIYTINRTKKRENLFKWIGPILSKKTYLYKMKDREDINIVNYEDAKNFTTAVILGHSLTTRLLDKGFKEGKELITTPNKDVQIKVFLKGRADLITGNQYTIYQSLKSEGYSMKDVEPALFISARGYYLGANIDTNDAIIAKLQKANEYVQRSGFVDATIAKYIK